MPPASFRVENREQGEKMARNITRDERRFANFDYLQIVELLRATDVVKVRCLRNVDSDAGKGEVDAFFDDWPLRNILFLNGKIFNNGNAKGRGIRIVFIRELLRGLCASSDWISRLEFAKKAELLERKLSPLQRKKLDKYIPSEFSYYRGKKNRLKSTVRNMGDIKRFISERPA